MLIIVIVIGLVVSLIMLFAGLLTLISLCFHDKDWGVGVGPREGWALLRGLWEETSESFNRDAANFGDRQQEGKL